VAEYPSPPMSDVSILGVLQTLADPIRLSIVRALADGEPHAKSEAEWGFGVHKSTLAYHFRMLREGGITETIVRGRVHFMRLRRQELDAKFPGLISLLASSPDDQGS
jgi:DNA-binding transcriptional ArsR family regulator